MIKKVFTNLGGMDRTFQDRLHRMNIFNWDDFLRAGWIPGLTSEDKNRIDNEILFLKRSISDGEFRNLSHLPPKDHWRLYREIRNARKVVYLDIETTGRQIFHDEITMVGMYDGSQYQPLIAGINLCEEVLRAELSGFDMLVTHSGLIFDLPFLTFKYPGINFNMLHFDVSFAGQKMGLGTTLKEISNAMGLEGMKKFTEVQGFMFAKLWEEYQKGSSAALDLILENNRREVTQMERVADRLSEMLRAKETTCEPAPPCDMN